ncbi:MAG: serine/threonine-protein kinase, partial [bacterium]
MSETKKTSLSRKKIKTFSSHEERYEFIKEQGSGGVGRVYVAYDKKIGRKIAFKELLSQRLRTESEETEARFIREAKLTSQLEHPSIVTVHEVDLKDDGTPYYTMRRVKGKTLYTAIYESHEAEKPLRLLPHFRDLCNAVAYAHSRGIIHRDIKPENVMIGEFGETVVLDWGLAKMKGSSAEKEEDSDMDMNSLRDKNPLKTISGKPLGTPAYMSPEQAMGETEKIDEQSDIFSLGAVLYEILSGKQPFEGATTLEIINKVLHSEPPEIVNENPPPQELVAIARKAMHKKKEERYETASDLSKDISNYLSGEKITSYEYSSWELLKHFAKRNKTIIASAGVILLTVITAMIVSLNAYRKEADARVKQEKQRMKANFHISQALNEKARRLSVNKEYLSAAVYAAEALKNNPVFPGSPYHREDTEVKFPGAFKLIADSSSIIYRTIADEIYAVKKIIRTNKSVQSVALSPNNLSFAVGTSDGTVYVKKMNNGKNIKTFQFSDKEISDIAWFPEGDLIAVSSGKTITVISTGGRTKYKLTPHEDTITSVDISPDGKYILSGSVDKTLVLFRASDGKLLKHRQLHNGAVLDAVFSNSSEFIASAGGDRNIIISSFPDLKTVSILRGHTNAVHRIDFSKDDKLLASGGWDRKLIIWDVEEKEILNVSDPSTDTVFDVSFSHDIPRVFSANRSGYI